MIFFNRFISFLVIVVVMMVTSCSTEKDAAINRGYHNMTARFNGYYNAGVVIDLAMAGYRGSYVDDYYKLIPMDVYPPEKDAAALFPDMDVAIEKCERVILRHSMPNPTITKNKDKELCRWIDDNWLVIAQAHYIKREYMQAQQKFKYITETYTGEESVYEAQIWLAKTYIALKNYPEAKRILAKVEIAMEDAREIRDRKIMQKIKDMKGNREQKKKNKTKGIKEPALFPERLEVEYEATMADLYIQQGSYKLAIERLEKTVELCKDKKRKARYMFLLAQLYQMQGDGSLASDYYHKVANSNAPYDMRFQAQINRALSATSGGAAIRKELYKMLRDEKNAEFQDQIYYALAEMDIKDGNVPAAKENYSQSVYWSVKNDRQKGISYLRLADLHFAEKDYIRAQRYYDSCVTVMPEDYDGYEAIKSKAAGLSDLVFHYETVIFEDSVQMISSMDPEAREKFLEQALKDIKDAAALKKFQDEQRQLALQNKVNVQSDAGGDGSKWYFYNVKVRGSGFNDYRAQWGTRPLEDNWRRSNKTTFSFNEDNPDSVVTEVKSIDSLTVEDLMADIPLTREAIDSSNNKLMNSLYMLGIIYKEQLKEEPEAISYFKQVVNRGVEHPRVLAALYQLYLIYQKNGSGEADTYKNQILDRYPDSEIAKLMLDPDYLKKKNEENKKELNDYAATLDNYQDRNYGAVIYKCNEVIAYDSTNQFVNKYYLLKAFAISKTDPGNTAAIASPLEALYAKSPTSDEGKQAKIYLDKINAGAPIVDPDKVTADTTASAYTVNMASPHFFILVFPNDKGNVEASKIKLSNFNSEFFRSKRYSVSASPFDTNRQLIIVKTFANGNEAGDYLNAFKSAQSKVTLGNMAADFETYIVHSANFTELFGAKDLTGYKTFYEANYP